jgi:cobyrinic acid a,c-diamide synthase
MDGMGKSRVKDEEVKGRPVVGENGGLLYLFLFFHSLAA